MKKKGITLVELLVTIAIIGIVGGVIVPIFWEQKNKTEVEKSIINLKKELRSLQNKARSEMLFSEIEIERGSEKIKITICEESKCKIKKEETFLLALGVKSQTALKIKFIPPFGEIEMESDVATVSLKKGEENKSLKIYKKSGLIEKIISEKK